MNNTLKYIFILPFFIAIVGCNNQKEIARKKPLPPKRPEFLVTNVLKNEFNPKWLKIKASVAFKTDKAEDSFKMNIRMRKDSAIWVSSTYYSVEVARFLITPDSVKFMDRKEKTFFVGKYDYLTQKFNINLSFNTIQSLILGNSLGISDSSKIDAYSENNMYVLSTFKKRKIKKATDDKPDKERRLEKLSEIAFLNWISPKDYKILKLAINDFKEKKSLKAEYTEHQSIIDQKAPKKYTMNVLSEKQIDLEVEYLKIEANQPLSFSFNIPSKYEQVFY